MITCKDCLVSVTFAWIKYEVYFSITSGSFKMNTPGARLGFMGTKVIFEEITFYLTSLLYSALIFR